MRWQTRNKDRGVSERALGYLRRKVETALRNMGDRIVRVRVQLAPERGGGAALRRARVVVTVNGGTAIVAEETDSSVHAAADRLADRLRRSVERWRGRRGGRRARS